MTVSLAPNIKTSIERIEQKLERIRLLDSNLKLFGAQEHKYQLSKPLSEQHLAAVEEKMGMSLPAGYRAFLRYLGNGGAGPYYGVHPLEYSLATVSAVEEDESYIDPDIGVAPLSLAKTLENASWATALASSFPLDDDVDFAEELEVGELPWKEHSARLQDDKKYIAAWDAIEQKYTDPRWLQGTLRVAEYGCGDCFFVVVGGKHTDKVWVDSIDGVTGIYNTRVPFLKFFENWLDHYIQLAQGKQQKDDSKSYAYLEYGENPRYGSKLE